MPLREYWEPFSSSLLSICWNCLNVCSQLKWQLEYIYSNTPGKITIKLTSLKDRKKVSPVWNTYISGQKPYIMKLFCPIRATENCTIGRTRWKRSNIATKQNRSWGVVENVLQHPELYKNECHEKQRYLTNCAMRAASKVLYQCCQSCAQVVMELNGLVTRQILWEIPGAELH